MRKLKKIAIIWANPYNKNLGVAALAYSALSLVQDVIDESGIEAEITIVGSSKRTSDSIVVGDKTLRFNNMLGLDYLHWKSLLKLVLQPRKYAVSKLSSFDLVLDVGEGDSFADIYGERRYRRILNSKKLFSFLRKKQVLLPQTIGPFKDPKKENEAFGLMKKMEKILSRDEKSYNLTSKFLPETLIEEIVDMAFYMPFERQTKSDNFIHVGINVSGLLWNGGYTGNNQFNMKTNFRELIIRCVEYFSSIPEVKIHIVSHVIPEKNPVEDDSKIASELKERFPEVVLSPRFNTPIEAKSYISGLDFFTGGRMHACIAAFSSGVAVVPMAYSRKFNGLFGDTLRYKWIADCVNSETDVVFNAIKDGYEQRDILAKDIVFSEEQVIKPRIEKLKHILRKSISN